MLGSAFLKPCFIYPKMLTADIILQYVRAMQNSMGSNIETLYKIVADKAEALEFRVRGIRENDTRRQDIEIYYSFVGKIDLPEA